MSGLKEPLAEVLARVGPGWKPLVDDWLASPQGRGLVEHVHARQREGAVIYPAEVLRALELTPLEAVRVVILGQDPYHGAGQAEGLAFSVPHGEKIPPSLRNIQKELARDLGCTPSTSGHLGAWARHGVLLLNASLTVEDGQPGSHARKGWEALTDRLVAAVAARREPTVFMLWGAHAQAKKPLIDAAGRDHLVLQANHPSPLSATRPPLPFIGCGHFGEANRFLLAHGRGPAVDWGA